MSLGMLDGKRGDVAAILGVRPGTDGLADLSKMDWGTSLQVVRGLTLRRAKVCQVEFRPKLVECCIEDSFFSDISAETHFWGAGNCWNRTRFLNTKLLRVNSGQNRFEDCHFERVSLVNYQLCETVFVRCSFAQVSFEGMKALPRTGLAHYPELDQLGVAAALVECSIAESKFSSCYFGQIGFARSTFKNILTQNCDMTGIVSDVCWWDSSKTGDPFLVLLDEVLLAISRILGENSTALRAMRHYKASYISGATRSRNYSACLFDGRVPYEDVRRLEKALEQLEHRFPF